MQMLSNVKRKSTSWRSKASCDFAKLSITFNSFFLTKSCVVWKECSTKRVECISVMMIRRCSFQDSASALKIPSSSRSLNRSIKKVPLGKFLKLVLSMYSTFAGTQVTAPEDPLNHIPL
ncbi:hypothetical protein CARUB_v10010685mg [Capsella rubella]|uniref:Uncharacterized protein n=1 Tax=Capsella rubella TaxID=81985 RepID=R0I265_9BRAS|nr:hypothetical protein CARUB_v10010685mg [Capsella rubella]EOA36339.1 hypothetical protein CARUB_v10010685mg [Capsella rubella]